MSPSFRRAVVVALVLVSAAAVGPAPTLAAKGTGLFSVTPGRYELTGRPPGDLPPTTVSNTTPRTLRVRVYPALLAQQLSGSVVITTAPQNLFAARKIVSVKPKKFTLAPGESRQLTVRWLDLPLKAKAAYVGVVVRGTPQRKEKRGVKDILQLVQSNYLRLRSPAKVAGVLEGLRAQQGARRTIELFSRVRNTGQIQGRPLRRRILIRRGGTTVFRGRWRAPQVVLPGFAVEFPMTVRKLLPAGDYVATTSMAFGPGKRTQRASTKFHLVGPNKLPTVSFDLASAVASGEIDGGATVHARVRNNGTAAAKPTVVARLFDREVGGRVVAVKRVTFDTFGVGKAATEDISFGSGLKKHPYRVDLAVASGRTVYDRLSATFTPKPGPSAWSVIWKVLVGLAVLALLVLIGWLVWRSRARRLSLERELEEARAAAQAPATPSSGVLAVLNSGDAAALTALPGVGAASAARIVAYRDEHGSFASVDDLVAVEGFGAAKVAKIAAAQVAPAEPPPSAPVDAETRAQRRAKLRREAADRRMERRAEADKRARSRKDADARKREEAEERKREEAEARAREEAERREREEAERREREAAEAREREEAEQRRREEAEHRERAAAEAREREEAERQRREDAERREREEADRRDREEAERRVREAAEARAREEAEQQRRAEAEQRERGAAEARAREQAAQREREAAERREREADAAPQPAAASPAGGARPAERPPPWADSSRVNVNEADVAELTRLPGIGRGAARRIVAHREQHGAFGSVQELAQVEGFDEARVRRLASRATV